MDVDALFVVTGPAIGARIDVDDELLIGRRAGGPGQLGGDPELSRRHALITRSDAGLTIVDLASTNGTLVNGRPVAAPTPLGPGDRIELGTSAIEVRRVAALPSRGTDRAGAPSAEPGAGGDRPASAGAEPAAGAVRPATPGAEPGAGGDRPARPSGEPALPAFASAPHNRRGERRRRMAQWIVVIALAAVAVAVAAVIAIVRGTRDAGSATAGPPFDGTAYVESNVAARASNSILALRYRAGSFRPLDIREYPTGGSGSADLTDSGVLDADQQVIVNGDHALLFAVNQGSDTIAVFHIAPDGSLTAVRGSPFPSEGTAPASLGISGDILVVANKADDGVRALNSVQANYTTFRVQHDGALRWTGSTFLVPPLSRPTQVYVAPGGKLVYTTEESGVLRGFRLTAQGKLIEAPGSPYPLPNSLFAPHQRPQPVWPAGLSADGGRHVLYSGIPNYGAIVAFDYADSGALTLDGSEADSHAFLPCWSVVSADGRRLYFANAGTDNISVWDVATDPHHPRLLQTVSLRGGGNPWNLRLDPSGKYLYIITPRQVAVAVPPGKGQLLHSLSVAPDGTLTELADSPVPLPVALDTNPFGLAVVARRRS